MASAPVPPPVDWAAEAGLAPVPASTAAPPATTVRSRRAPSPGPAGADGDVRLDVGRGAGDGTGGGGDAPAASAATQKEVDKAEEKKKKAIKDYMSTALSSERTFFRWMWAALNLGALGTFALTFFSDDKFPFRLIVTGTAWTLGLVSALYGLRQFHRRRRALLTNTLDPAKWESPAAPGAVIAIFAVVVAAVVIYAAASGYSFALRKPGILNPKILDRDE